MRERVLKRVLMSRVDMMFALRSGLLFSIV
jgi:hypothetical protein